MKKILVYGLSVLLVVILVVFASRLVGCGNNLSGETGSSVQTGSSTTISLATLPTYPVAHEFLFASCNSNEVMVFSVEATGDLSQTQDLNAPLPSGLRGSMGLTQTIYPSGKFIYLQALTGGWAAGDPTHILIYGFDADHGLLSQNNPDSPIPYIAPSPQFVINPAATLAYTPNEFFEYSPVVKITNGYDICDIGISDGSLTLKQTDEISSITGQAANKLIFHPSGNYAYLILNATRTLITPMTGTSVEVTPCSVAGDGSISTQPPVFAETVAINEIINAAIDPNGKNLFILKRNAKQMLQLAIDSSGLPGAPVTMTVSDKPIDIAFHPSGLAAYVLTQTSIDIYSIGSATNAVGFVKSVSLPSPGIIGILTGTAPIAIIADPSGQFVYAMDSNAEKIYAYKIEASGDLTKTSTDVSTGHYPKEMVVWGK